MLNYPPKFLIKVPAYLPICIICCYCKMFFFKHVSHISLTMFVKLFRERSVKFIYKCLLTLVVNILYIKIY